jgi:hypothetical protein
LNVKWGGESNPDSRSVNFRASWTVNLLVRDNNDQPHNDRDSRTTQSGMDSKKSNDYENDCGEVFLINEGIAIFKGDYIIQS